jgi:hypothetical protein
MLTGLYKVFEKKTVIIVNKMLSESFCAASWNEYFANSGNLHASIIGLLPCFCDILKNEGNSLYTIENPNHPFTMMLKEIAKKIECLTHDPSNTEEAAGNHGMLS